MFAAYSLRRPTILRLATATLLLTLVSGTTSAFPLIGDDQVVPSTEPAASEVLRHQLQMNNGLSAPAGGGWTIVPRLDWQEELTDNVLQEHAPRRADLVTFIAPGISLAGDLPRAQV